MIKITKENFDQHKTKLNKIIKDNLPKDAKEFSSFCENIFGFKVSESFVAVYPNGDDLSVKYEIKKPTADKIRSNKIFGLWYNYYHQLDREKRKHGDILLEKDPFKMLLNATFGELSCGGIATCYYGQTDTEGIDATQIENLIHWDNRNNADKVVDIMQEQSKHLKEIFGYDPFTVNI